jgi:hypothetical protein
MDGEPDRLNSSGTDVYIYLVTYTRPIRKIEK